MGNHKKLFTIMLVFSLALTGGYALLVDYLSNNVEATVTVESPISLEVLQGEEYVTVNEPIPLNNVAGSQLTLEFREVNKDVNTNIEGVLSIDISNVEVDYADIEQLDYVLHNTDGTDTTTDLLVNGNPIVEGNILNVKTPITTDLVKYKEFDIVIKFADNIEPGEYSIDTQVLVE